MKKTEGVFLTLEEVRAILAKQELVKKLKRARQRIPETTPRGDRPRSSNRGVR